MTWEEYVDNELKYYDEHPEEDDYIIEAHSNSFVALDLDYTVSYWTVLIVVVIRYICLIVHADGL